jgi:hypothetical protein
MLRSRKRSFERGPRELLRRPVVIDQLVRGRVSGIPLNEPDAMDEV